MGALQNHKGIFDDKAAKIPQCIQVNFLKHVLEVLHDTWKTANRMCEDSEKALLDLINNVLTVAAFPELSKVLKSKIDSRFKDDETMWGNLFKRYMGKSCARSLSQTRVREMAAASIRDCENYITTKIIAFKGVMSLTGRNAKTKIDREITKEIERLKQLAFQQ